MIKTDNYTGGGFLYFIENLINGNTYIGLTNNPIRRWKDHQKMANNLAHKDCSYIHKAINKYGVDNFSFQVFSFYNTYIEAKIAETFWVAELKQYDTKLYNLTDGGDGIVGYKYTEEEKEANRQRQKAIADIAWEAKLGKLITHNIECAECHNTFQFTKREMAKKKIPEYCVMECFKKKFARHHIENKHIRSQEDINKQKATFDATNERNKGKLITYTIKCQMCPTTFIHQRREKTVNMIPLPKFCCKDCKYKGRVYWGKASEAIVIEINNN